MLYDKKWDKKVDLFSLPSLIAWLEQQDETETYDPCSPNKCVLGQFAAAMGAKNHGRKSLQLETKKQFAEIAFGEWGEGPHTFGAALKRARVFLTD